MARMQFQFVFNAHLPFVRFPKIQDCLEERWLFEAILESYIPLLEVIHDLKKDSIPFNFTLALSPTLLHLLDDDLLKERFYRYIKNLLKLVDQEIYRCRYDNDALVVVHMYQVKIQKVLKIYTKLNGDIISKIKKYAKAGYIELMATAATGAFFPLYRSYPQLIHAQVREGVAGFSRHFGFLPNGFWLPHCGYYEGLDEILLNYGIKYTISAAHGVLDGYPTPQNGIYAPIQTQAGLVIFPRERQTVDTIWHMQDGYPSTPVYRDFYRDIGFDLPLADIKDFILPDGTRIATGLKYMAIGHDDAKTLYKPALAYNQAINDATHFISVLQKIGYDDTMCSGGKIVTCPIDAEFFGHWWFEGTQFLNSVFRQLAHQDDIAITHPSRILKERKDYEVVMPVFSSWGNNGYAQAWLDQTNVWLIRHLYKMIDRMVDLAQRFVQASTLQKRVLNQAAKEVMLSMASDWPLLILNRSNQDFAIDQIRRHMSNFYKIYDALGRGTLNANWMIDLENQNNIQWGKEFTYRIFDPDFATGLKKRCAQIYGYGKGYNDG